MAGGHLFAQVRPGVNHTCAITTTGVAFCWGANTYGQLGDGTHTFRLTPVRVNRGLNWRWISPGAYHTCGVTTDNRAWCFGKNSFGAALGGGDGSNRSNPRAVVGGLQFRHVESGYFHTCGVTTAYRAYCWGYNGDGEFGDGTLNIRSSPMAVAGNLQFSHISATEFYTCAVSRAGQGFCWGNNPRGELG